MSQYVNLLSQLGLGERDWLSGAKLLQWVAITALLVVALGLLDHLRYLGQYRQAERYAAQLAEAQEREAALLATMQGIGDVNTLEQAIGRLEARSERLRGLLERLDASPGAEHGGLARFLSGLGSRELQGLWFTAIDIRQGGERLTLSGHSRSAEAVPRYLRALRDETAFSGQQFSLLQIAASESPGLLDFVIRSAREGE